MTRVCLGLALALASGLAAPARAQAQPEPAFYTMKGTCVSFRVGSRDATDTCKGILIKSINNGFVDFDFVTSEDATLIFSGRGTQVKPDDNTAIQPVTEVFFQHGKQKGARVPAVGSCRYTNPYIGVATVDCTAEIDGSITFHAAFRSNGAEPDKMNLH